MHPPRTSLRWLRELNLVNDVHADLVILGYVTNDPEVKAPNGEYYIKQIGRDVPYADLGPAEFYSRSSCADDRLPDQAETLGEVGEPSQGRVRVQGMAVEASGFTEYRRIRGDCRRSRGLLLRNRRSDICCVATTLSVRGTFSAAPSPDQAYLRGRRHSILRFGRPVLQRVRKRRQRPHLGYQSGQRPSRAHCHSFLCSPGGGYSRTALLRRDRAAFRRCSTPHAADQ